MQGDEFLVHFVHALRLEHNIDITIYKHSIAMLSPFVKNKLDIAIWSLLLLKPYSEFCMSEYYTLFVHIYALQ